MIKAVIDVGSNSVILSIAENINAQWNFIYEEDWTTALGNNTKQTKLLSKESINTTLKALKLAFETAHQYRATKITAYTTMAARMAKNAPEFLTLAQSQHTPLTLLSGEDEAWYSFLSIAIDPQFINETLITVIDPGAQSTELITAQKTDSLQNNGSYWKICFMKSFPLGSLGLRGDILANEKTSLSKRIQASKEIDDLIGFEYLPDKAGRTFVLGAAGTNLISIRENYHLWEPKKIHGSKLTYEEISRAAGWMSDMTDNERKNIKGIQFGREKTLHISCLIVERFLHAIHVDHCTVSIRGWRHALLESNL